MKDENTLTELLDVFINMLRSKELEENEEEQIFLNRLFTLKRKVAAEIKYLRDEDPRLKVGEVLLDNITNEIKKEIYYNTIAFSKYKESDKSIVVINGNENAVKALLKKADMLGIKWRNVEFYDRIKDFRT